MTFELTQALVKNILKTPLGLKWSVQGLGMLRTYLDDKQRYRLHIWDSSLRVPNVSPIHDHPWHLDSLIVSGVLHQYRYSIGDKIHPYVLRYRDSYPVENFQMSVIKCGEGAYAKSDPVTVQALQHGKDTYYPGENYSQRKDEVHESMAEDGTVTIVDRTFTQDRESARVFWRGEGGWVDAAPRRATDEEIIRVTQKALEGFSEV